VLDQCRVEPGSDARLAHRATDATLGLDKGDADRKLAKIHARLGDLHNRLWAEHARAVLLVLQGLDASGKDGTIKRVFTGLNPQGCEVQSFKAPTSPELDHDYLWRIHQVLPPRGGVGIFNRSHYEDVATAQVVGAIDAHRRKRRYEHINGFERMLHDESTTVVKVFLHVGKDEQRKRLQARLEDPAKRWKFRRDDLTVRSQWDEYTDLYDAALTATSTKCAPWYVVPADHKWVSGIVVAHLLATTLEDMDPKIPPAQEDLTGIVVE
jgi:PPK2 family polyphosphate:nucleotide phosphotransferase